MELCRGSDQIEVKNGISVFCSNFDYYSPLAAWAQDFNFKVPKFLGN
jgi:hypothetical protein